MLKKILITAAIGALLTGCATSNVAPPHSADPLLRSVQYAADSLAVQMLRFPATGPIVVASAQNNDQLKQVCPQGRLVGDITSSRLTQYGFPVTEVRLTRALRITKEGETILSRDLSELASAAKVNTIVTATWSTLKPNDGVLYANAGGGADNSRHVAGWSTLPDGTVAGPSGAGQTYLTLKAVRISDGRILGSQTVAPPASWSCD